MRGRAYFGSLLYCGLARFTDYGVGPAPLNLGVRPTQIHFTNGALQRVCALGTHLHLGVGSGSIGVGVVDS